MGAFKRRFAQKVRLVTLHVDVATYIRVAFYVAG